MDASNMRARVKKLRKHIPEKGTTGFQEQFQVPVICSSTLATVKSNISSSWNRRAAMGLKPTSQLERSCSTRTRTDMWTGYHVCVLLNGHPYLHHAYRGANM